LKEGFRRRLANGEHINSYDEAWLRKDVEAYISNPIHDMLRSLKVFDIINHLDSS